MASCTEAVRWPLAPASMYVECGSVGWSSVGWRLGSRRRSHLTFRSVHGVVRQRHLVVVIGSGFAPVFDKSADKVILLEVLIVELAQFTNAMEVEHEVQELVPLVLIAKLRTFLLQPLIERCKIRYTCSCCSSRGCCNCGNTLCFFECAHLLLVLRSSALALAFWHCLCLALGCSSLRGCKLVLLRLWLRLPIDACTPARLFRCRLRCVVVIMCNAGTLLARHATARSRLQWSSLER